jgi:hypothetical protein
MALAQARRPAGRRASAHVVSRTQSRNCELARILVTLLVNLCDALDQLLRQSFLGYDAVEDTTGETIPEANGMERPRPIEALNVT